MENDPVLGVCKDEVHCMMVKNPGWNRRMCDFDTFGSGCVRIARNQIILIKIDPPSTALVL